MSWSGGTDTVFDIMRSFKEHKVEDRLRHVLYVDLIESLRGSDWGSCDECVGLDPMYDEALEVVRRRWCEKHDYNYDELFGDDA